ncbi:MAG: hypothetical protein K2I96_17955 [Lachnospiraceae bacterium]|nr:hypothetical protein [Lachnospiraceae bacterium]
MKRKKNILATLTLIAALSFTAMPVLAAESEDTDSLEVTITSEDGQEISQMYDLFDLSATVEDEDGIMPLINISADTLANGYTMTFRDSDGSDFYITGGSTVTFTVKLKSSAHVVMGYKDSNGNMTQTYDGTAKTNTTKISIANTGRYSFYLTNASDSTLNITGGSITF